MIDHAIYRRQLATTIDFALDGDAAIELDHHVVGCPDCTAFETSLRRDAAVLRELDLGSVANELREELGMEAGRRIGGGTLRWVTLAAATVLLLTAVGAGAVSVGALRTGVPDTARPPTGVAAAAPVDWDNGLIQVQADEAWFEAEGVRRALPQAVLGGDDSKGATIIVRSGQGEADMTLLLTFKGDGPDWSLEQVELWRAGAGRFRQLVGSPAVVGGTSGDPGVDATIPLRTLNGDVEGGRIVFRGLRANVLAITTEQPVPPFPVKARVPDVPPLDPLGPNGFLTCSGLLQAATPLEAEALAAKLGWGIAWRVRWSGEGGAVFERDEVQPQEGTIIDATLMEATGDAPNAVLLVVAAPGDPLAVPIPAPKDCPVPGEPMPPDPVPEVKPSR